jgi:hypothetical protein
MCHARQDIERERIRAGARGACRDGDVRINRRQRALIAL